MKCQSVSNMNKQIGEKGAELSRAQKTIYNICEILLCGWMVNATALVINKYYLCSLRPRLSGLRSTHVGAVETFDTNLPLGLLPGNSCMESWPHFPITITELSFTP